MIEYEKHLEYIGEIAKVDIKAALYLRHEAPATLNPFNINAPLHCMFFWNKTPQGFQYWNDIYFKLTGKHYDEA